MSFLTRAYGASKLALKSNAPTIMVVTGVVSMGAAAILGAKQTLRVEDELAKHIPSLEKIKKGQELRLDGYNEEAAAKDRGRVYARVAIDLTKLYAVPAVCFVGGAALVFGGHRLMLKRNASLALAFTGLKKSFDAYRQRVIEANDEMTDQVFMNGYEVKEVIDPETGKVETITTRDWEISNQDPYNRVFSQQTSTMWEPNLGVNRMFLFQQMKFAQQRLNVQGYIYLSDIYKSLGIEETPESRVVGWKTRRLSDGSRDIPVVDFGLDKALPDDWKYNKANEIYLDFNCQGLIVGGDVQRAIEAY